MIASMPGFDPFKEWVGEVIGSFALDPASVDMSEVREAVAYSQIVSCETEEELWNPLNDRLVDLFITP